MQSKHSLPPKVLSYLRRMHSEYLHSAPNLAEIIASSRVLVIEETDYDNWNGGTHGHDVKLFLSLPMLGRIRIESQKEVSEKLTKYLNLCAESVQNEFIREVVFELENDEDSEFQKAVSFSERPTVNPDGLSIWKQGHIRLFISHRDQHKAVANFLAAELQQYGISAFVAHDTIEPMSTWQHEIIKGLETMEVMLAIVTDDFHDSVWTNQEIGYALGKNIPVIPFKVESKDPTGFIGTIQALKGRLDSLGGSAVEIYKLVADGLGNRSRLNRALIGAFVGSVDFIESRDRFNAMTKAVDKMSELEAEEIVQAFKSNSQLHNSIYLTNSNDRLVRFMQSSTGRQYRIENGELVCKKPVGSGNALNDDIPF